MTLAHTEMVGNNRPLFSIIIPLFNKQDYVARTIASIAAQSFRNFEVIVVDDCSTDKGLERCLKELRIAQLQHVVASTAWNSGSVALPRSLGRRMSSGRWHAFIDADDEWDATYLETINEMILDDPSYGAYGVNRKILDNGLEHTAIDSDADSGHFIAIDLTRFLSMRATVGNPLRVPGLVFDPDVIDAVGGFRPTPRSGDVDLIFRLFLAGFQVRWTAQPLLTVNRVPHSVMSQTQTVRTRSWYYTVEEALDRQCALSDARALRLDIGRSVLSDLRTAQRLGSVRSYHVSLRRLIYVIGFLFDRARVRFSARRSWGLPSR